MIELADKDITIAIINTFYIFIGIEEDLNMIRKEMDDIKKTQIKLVVKNTICELKNAVDKINSNSTQTCIENRRINTSQLILESQHYPDTKTRQKHYKNT